jgi:hypothetical protein
MTPGCYDRSDREAMYRDRSSGLGGLPGAQITWVKSPLIHAYCLEQISGHLSPRFRDGVCQSAGVRSRCPGVRFATPGFVVERLRRTGRCAEGEVGRWPRVRRAMSRAVSRGALRDPGLCCGTPSAYRRFCTGWGDGHGCPGVRFAPRGSDRSPLRARRQYAKGVPYQSPGSRSAPWVTRRATRLRRWSAERQRRSTTKPRGREAHPGY